MCLLVYVCICLGSDCTNNKLSKLGDAIWSHLKTLLIQWLEIRIWKQRNNQSRKETNRERKQRNNQSRKEINREKKKTKKQNPVLLIAHLARAPRPECVIIEAAGSSPSYHTQNHNTQYQNTPMKTEIEMRIEYKNTNAIRNCNFDIVTITVSTSILKFCQTSSRHIQRVEKIENVILQELKWLKLSSCKCWKGFHNCQLSKFVFGPNLNINTAHWCAIYLC